MATWNQRFGGVDIDILHEQMSDFDDVVVPTPPASDNHGNRCYPDAIGSNQQISVSQQQLKASDDPNVKASNHPLFIHWNSKCLDHRTNIHQQSAGPVKNTILAAPNAQRQPLPLLMKSDKSVMMDCLEKNKQQKMTIDRLKKQNQQKLLAIHEEILNIDRLRVKKEQYLQQEIMRTDNKQRRSNQEQIATLKQDISAIVRLERQNHKQLLALNEEKVNIRRLEIQNHTQLSALQKEKMTNNQSSHFQNSKNSGKIDHNYCNYPQWQNVQVGNVVAAAIQEHDQEEQLVQQPQTQQNTAVGRPVIHKQLSPSSTSIPIAPQSGFLSRAVPMKTGEFTKEETDTIVRAVKEYCTTKQISFTRLLVADLKGSWMEIAKCLPNRTVLSIYKHGVRQLHPFKRGAWSDEEVDMLYSLVIRIGKDWNLIQAKLNRSAESCYDKYRKMTMVPLGGWKGPETEQLKQVMREFFSNQSFKGLVDPTADIKEIGKIVKAEGIRIPWAAISKRMGGKRSKWSCYKQWRKMAGLYSPSDMQRLMGSTGDAASIQNNENNARSIQSKNESSTKSK